ncbi:hypothetical protein Tco_1081133 [Tanacetum coccineum]|uniref:Uncharacterized protein n=1 Tax=Tanacetum coccineum TaxID=301880 RepID=A0ABQ5HYN8_9ASTR
MIQPEPGGIHQDIPLNSVVVLRCEKRSKGENTGRVPIEMELVLEQTQQGTTYEVSISAEGVEELKRKVKIQGIRRDAARRGRVRFIAACSYSTDIHKDIMKAQIAILFYTMSMLRCNDDSAAISSIINCYDVNPMWCYVVKKPSTIPVYEETPTEEFH